MKGAKYYLFGLHFLPITPFRVLILVVFLLFATTSIGFAVWDNTDTTFDDTIIIGDGASLVVVPITERPSDVYWVPLGAFRGKNDIDHYLYEFNVVFNKEGRLNVALQNSLLGEDPFDLLDAKIYLSLEDLEAAEEVLSIDLVEEGPYFDEEEGVFNLKVYVKVFFNEPESEEVYDMIRNNEVSFEIHFKAEDLYSNEN